MTQRNFAPEQVAVTEDVPKINILVRVSAYLLSPALLIYSAYQLWNLAEALKAGLINEALIQKLLTFAISFAVFCCSALFSTYGLTKYFSEAKSRIRETGLQRRTRYQIELLRLVADNLPNAMFMADSQGRIWFANKEIAQQLNSDKEKLVGKSIEKVFNPRISKLLLERIRRAKTAKAPVITIDRQEIMGGTQYMQTYHIPLDDTEDLHDLVLITQKDVTDVIIERERQDQTFKQIIDTLIAVVDRRDPYAAGHSVRVGSISHAIATELNLDAQDVEACEIAGSLMNLGKVLVPRSILVKTTALSAEELQLVRKSILTSADILSLISFQVPVIATLKQVLERVDGLGEPEKRKGNNILITARIISVANAFIALVSPRAHRAGLSIEAAMTSLKNDCNTLYDKKVVDALEQYLSKNPDARDNLIQPPPEMRGLVIDREFLGD
jgi:PAS domain S-box-containing protein